jgi:CRP-like cAMP-binding protein
MAVDAQLQKLSRELFLAAVAPPSIPGWVIERTALALEERVVNEGDLLFKAGDPPAYIYFMREGRVRFTLEGGAPITFVGRWVFGGMEVATDRPRRRTATALASFRIHLLPADAWLELVEDSFEIARSMMANLARTLLRLEEAFGTDATDEVEVMPLLPRHDGALSLVERLTLLADVPALRGAGIQTLADLAALTEEVVFEPGDVVMVRGETPRRGYVVFDGEVEGFRSSPDIVRRFGPGTLVLGATALAEIPMPWGARARTRVRALSFRLEDSIDLMEEHFDMVRSLLAELSTDRELLVDKVAAKAGELVLE